MSNGRIGPPWWLLGRGTGGSRTVSGPVAHWKDKVVAPLRSLLVNIDPVQEGTGDPSPDNVRPISGWMEANVWRTGVNVWDEEWEEGYYSSTGEPSGGSGYIRSKNYISVKPNESYYCKTGTASNFCLQFYGADKAFLSQNFTWRDSVVTIPSDCHYLRFWRNETTYANNISINYPSTDHDYHPYSGNQYTIQLGQTVYGGTLDVTNGVLTVDRAMVDLGTLDWNYNIRKYLYSEVISNIKTPETTVVVTDWALCSIYKPTSSTNIYGDAPNHDCEFAIFGGGYIGISDQRYSDATAFKAAMNGVQFVYELATPITIPLTPQEISTLQGTNNLWADSGDVTVTYLSGEGNPALVALALAHRIEE